MKKKKKRSRASKPVRKDVSDKEEEDERKAISALLEVFASASLEEAASAYREAKGDANKAGEILGGLLGCAENPILSTSSSASSGLSCSGSCLSEGDAGPNCVGSAIHVKGNAGKKSKKLIAATGTVSTVIGKDYVGSCPRRNGTERKVFCGEPPNEEHMEQFLCSMLGNESELSMAVVRDVLCQCRYDVEKALDALLKLCDPSYEPKNGRHYNHGTNNNKETGLLLDCTPRFPDGASDSTSHSSEGELQDNELSVGYGCRSYSEALSSSKARSLTSPRSTMPNLSQRVLEHLFNIPKSSEHEPNTMNWRDVAKKMESLGLGLNFCPPAFTESLQNVYAKGDEYQVFRKDAKQHWDSMRSYYQKAAAAYSNGDRHSAAYLSKQGKFHSKMAREAEEKASQQIFNARNRSIENVITIDLHGQHLKQAMSLLKVHLLFGTYVSSIQSLRVITGCGTHGVGKSKLKQSVINLVEKEGIEWKEENPGSVLIKLDGLRELSFLDSEDESN